MSSAFDMPRRTPDVPVVTDAELRALDGARVLVTGAEGMLGRSFVEALSTLGEAVRVYPFAHAALDVTNRDAVLRCGALEPTIILHCAGMVIADECEREPDRAWQVHLDGTRNVAELACASGARVLYPQSVFIFDGVELPVTERTVPNPGLVYGRAKVAAEAHLFERLPRTLSVRMAGFFGGDAKDKNFVGSFTRGLGAAIERGERVCEVGDRVWQPTYTLDLARNALLLLAHDVSGVVHMGSIGEATFFEVASACIEELGLGARIEVRACSSRSFDAAESAKRPSRMVTANARLDELGLNRQRPWRTALREYLRRPHFLPLRALAGAS